MCLIISGSPLHDNDKKMVFTIQMGEMTPERIEKAKQSLKEMMCEFREEVEVNIRINSV